MRNINFFDTAIMTATAGYMGYIYGENFKGVSSTEAAKAFAISCLAIDVLETAVFVACNSGVLNVKNYKIALISVTTAWGVASIVAFRQLNLIAGLGVAILSGFLALRCLQIVNT